MLGWEVVKFSEIKKFDFHVKLAASKFWMGFQKLCSETCLGPDIGHGNQTSVVSQGQGQKVEVMAGSGVRGWYVRGVLQHGTLALQVVLIHGAFLLLP